MADARGMKDLKGSSAGMTKNASKDVRIGNLGAKGVEYKPDALEERARFERLPEHVEREKRERAHPMHPLHGKAVSDKSSSMDRDGMVGAMGGEGRGPGAHLGTPDEND